MRSMLFPQLADNPVIGNRVKLPGIGWAKMRLSRPIPDGFIVKQAAVVKRASSWYVMLTLQADVQVPNIMPHGDSLGIDLGLISFLATSNGELFARLAAPFACFLKSRRVAQRILCRSST